MSCAAGWPFPIFVRTADRISSIPASGRAANLSMNSERRARDFSALTLPFSRTKSLETSL